MTKLVVRVLDAAGRMLGGVVHHAAMPGDGTLRAAGLVAVPVVAAGCPAVLSVHWCDPHVEVRSTLALLAEASVGDTVTVASSGDVLVRVGAPPSVALEPLVVGRHVVAVPVGGLGAKN